MKKYSLLVSLLFLIILFNGCEKKQIGTAVKMHWDRDMCQRCKMAISERKFAVQIIDKRHRKVYKFDDLGCAILWMDRVKAPWKDQAIIWISDAKTGKWVDGRKALYIEGAITPMAFGFAAYTKQTVPQNVTIYNLEDIIQKIRKTEIQNSKRVKTF
ncbi:MAG: hypothetical protein LGB07_05265 [Sulfurovum sp.]|nr:hypothetical protein [Sulfurovum sp.]MCB4745040.1 hypothetical protein [Sulfurovum sp.]MCB4746669.1 hypothetical protein [Sulfurovum sp.]MCB4748046.1 hypothetical protein [Sulfurovum sp.]MCB4748827.1 hypothetical protein [Sulfurovum sp.]